MLHKLAVFLIEKKIMIKRKNQTKINKNSFEEEVYYTELLLETLLTFATLFIISTFSGCTAEAFVFTLVFIWLRGNTGGYHAKTTFGCMAMTIIVSLCASLFAVHYPRHILSGSQIIITAAVFYVPVIFLFAPVNHPALSLSKEEMKQCAGTSKRITVLCTTLLIVLSANKTQEHLLISVSMAIFSVALSILIAKILKQEVNKHETNGNSAEKQREKKYV